MPIAPSNAPPTGSTLVLPELISQHGLPAPASGTWTSHSGADLDLLAKGLKSDTDSEYFNVDAIPDLWARPLLFEFALYEGNHVLHDKIVGEWRGLATLVALKLWRGFNLAAVRVDLTADANGPFLKAADRLAPTHSLFPNTGWKDLYVFLYENKAIGMTSPTTLFCTGVSYSAFGVPWFDRVLRDPLDPRFGGPHLNEAERKAVLYWLDTLSKNLNPVQQNAGGDNPANAFLGIINDFKRALGRMPEQHEAPALARDALGIAGSNAFRYLDEIPKPPTGNADTSHLRLVPSTDRDEGSHPLLVIDGDIAEQWNMPARDITVWGTLSLAAALPASGYIGNNQQELQGQHIRPTEWRRPSDFFMNTLYYFKSSTAGAPRAFIDNTVMEIDGERENGLNLILPLKPWILHYLSAADLSKRLEVRVVHNDYEVKLRLPLAGPHGQVHDFEISHRYSGQNLQRLSDLPTWGIWPDFTAETWKDYYTLYARHQAAVYTRPITGTSKGKVRTTRDNKDQIEKEVVHVTSYPEALECLDRKGNISYGVVLLQPPQHKYATGATFDIGVDFGTTNTTVYVNENGTQHILPFKNRVRQLTQQPASTEILLTDLLPTADIAPPFRTLYKPKPARPAGTPLRAILDGSIVYLTHIDLKQREYLGGVLSDLKWATDTYNRQLSKLFLEQVYLQAKAEAVAAGASTIRWRYSVPTSFSANQREYAKNTWLTLVGDQNADVVEHTESIATAAFFLMDMHAAMAAATVCIDIGGMSSDIAIWSANQVRLQTSVRVASRTILVKTLRNLPSVQKKILETASENETVIETILQRSGNELWDRLNTFNQDPDVEKVRQIVILGVGGILFYTGLLLRHLENKNLWNRRLPFIYVGGNGARMFHWLAGGRYTQTSPAQKVFLHFVRAATEFANEIMQTQITTDEKMKHEVAYGLVAQHHLQNKVTTSALAGEAFYVDEQFHEWNTELTDEILSKGINIPSGLKSLKKFVQTVNEYADTRDAIITAVTLGEHDWRKVEDGVTQVLTDYRGQDRRSIDPEPIFATALKKLLEVLQEKAKQ